MGGRHQRGRRAGARPEEGDGQLPSGSLAPQPADRLLEPPREQPDVEDLAAIPASSSVNRSNNNVPRPSARRRSATRTLRGDRLLEPLPCANTTTPIACSGIASSPGRLSPSASTVTVS
jgi:hypothetical protein